MLKRTPLPRSNKPLKRSPLNPSGKRLRTVSKKNSKPHRNKSVIDDYRDTHADCFNCRRSSSQTHHIFKGHRSRVDHPANIIRVCGDCHRIDDSEPVQFKIRCLHWKQERGEFDPAALYQISGEFMTGWLTRHPQEPGEIETMRVRLLNVCLGSGD